MEGPLSCMCRDLASCIVSRIGDGHLLDAWALRSVNQLWRAHITSHFIGLVRKALQADNDKASCWVARWYNHGPDDSVFFLYALLQRRSTAPSSYQRAYVATRIEAFYRSGGDIDRWRQPKQSLKRRQKKTRLWWKRRAHGFAHRHTLSEII